MTDDAGAKKTSALQMMLGYFRDFKVLKETPKQYWGIQIVNFLDCTAYFALLTVVSIFLSKEIGMDDKQAGYVITGFTSATTILLLIAGLWTDFLGIRRSLYIALISRGGLSVAVAMLALGEPFAGRGWVIAGCFVLMAPGMAMVQTVFQAANKRFTSERSRSAGFSLWYLFMNIGAAAAGGMVDVVRLKLGLSTTYVIGMGAVTSTLCVLVVIFLIRSEKQFLGPDEVPEPEPETKEAKKRPWQIFKEMIREPTLWRFLVLIFLLLGVRAVFTYMYLLMPKYWLRVMGEGAAIGSLTAINPVLIVIGIVLFLPLANRFHIFKMLVYGSMVSAISLFVLVIPWTVFSSDFVTAYYWMSVCCMFVLSIGEVIWSPKLSEYTAAIAPKGQEGSYLGLSMVPWFLAKTVVSLVSGHLLTRWVPKGIGEGLRAGTVAFWDTPEAMWLVLGLYAAGGCIIARVIQGWLTKGARWKIDEIDAAAKEAPEEQATKEQG